MAAAQRCVFTDNETIEVKVGETPYNSQRGREREDGTPNAHFSMCVCVFCRQMKEIRRSSRSTMFSARKTTRRRCSRAWRSQLSKVQAIIRSYMAELLTGGLI